MSDFLLYHWSPKDRRKSIEHYGLRPGHLSTDHIWRPPVVCFAESPSLAWSLSADTGRGRQHQFWDLWMVWSSTLLESGGYEIIPMDDGTPREYRFYFRVWKRDLWYVGTREQKKYAKQG